MISGELPSRCEKSFGKLFIGSFYVYAGNFFMLKLLIFAERVAETCVYGERLGCKDELRANNYLCGVAG